VWWKAKLGWEMIDSHFLETNLNFRTDFAGTRNKIWVTRSLLPMTASTDDDFFCFGLFKDTCEQLGKEEVIVLLLSCDSKMNYVRSESV
jgi:hypothetical protein